MPNYPKLVRDRIPEIIKAKEGKDVPVRILADDVEYLQHLLDKLTEEAHEVKEAGHTEEWEKEMADLFEVITAILKLKGSDIERIVAVQRVKRAERGAFEKRILMLGEEE